MKTSLFAQLGTKYETRLWLKDPSYISKISGESLGKLMMALNKVAIGEGVESVGQFRQHELMALPSVIHS